MADAELQWKDNVDRFIGDLQKKKFRATAMAQLKMRHGMRSFESKVIREQMSGRNKGPNGTGLNRITRFLAGSTDVGVSREEGDFVVRMSVGAPYARAHQGVKSGNTWTPFVINHPGTSNGFGKGISIPAHKITMPKRLAIPEDFLVSGTRLIINALRSAVQEYAK